MSIAYVELGEFSPKLLANRIDSTTTQRHLRVASDGELRDSRIVAKYPKAIDIGHLLVRYDPGAPVIDHVSSGLQGFDNARLSLPLTEEGMCSRGTLLKKHTGNLVLQGSLLFLPLGPDGTMQAHVQSLSRRSQIKGSGPIATLEGSLEGLEVVLRNRRVDGIEFTHLIGYQDSPKADMTTVHIVEGSRWASLEYPLPQPEIPSQAISRSNLQIVV